MSYLKALVRNSLSLSAIAIGLTALPAAADGTFQIAQTSQTSQQQCTTGPGNRTVCTTTGGSTTRTTSSQECTTGPGNRTVCTTTGGGTTRTTTNSSSSSSSTNVDVNITGEDVENIFKGIFNNRNRNNEPTQNNRNLQQNNRSNNDSLIPSLDF